MEQEGPSRQEADTILACFTETGTHLVNFKADTFLACFTKTGSHMVNSKAKTHVEKPEANTIHEPPHDPSPAQACPDDWDNPPGPASEEVVNTRLRELVEELGKSRGPTILGPEQGGPPLLLLAASVAKKSPSPHR